MSLPDSSNLQVALGSVLELALLRKHKQAAAVLHSARIGQCLRKLFAQEEHAGRQLPKIVVFGKPDAIALAAKQGELAHVVAPDDSIQPRAVELPAGGVDIWAQSQSEQPETLVVFVRTASGQSFYVDGHRVLVDPNAEPPLYSFGTHHDLRRALEYYGATTPPASLCGYLEQCWHDPVARVLSNKPERLMRDSLYVFLRRELRHCDVDREFTIGALKPVDILVSWRFGVRRGLVEVKWLGESLTSSGKTFTYSNSRLVRGGRQLRDHYVVPYGTANPDVELLGYLVTFDARNSPSATSLPLDLKNDKRLRLEFVWSLRPAPSPV